MVFSYFEKKFRSIKKSIQTFALLKKRKTSLLIKRIKELQTRGARTEKREKKEDLSTSILSLAFISSMFVGGLLFVAIFLPLTLISAREYGLDPTDVIFFAHLMKILPNKGPLDLARLLYELHHLPTLFSFATLYGVSGLAIPFLLIVIKKKGWIELIIMSNGLYLGYIFTYIIASNILEYKENTLGINKLSRFSFAYVLILYYLASGLIELFSRHGMKSKFDHLFMGAYGICSAWILSKVFQKASVVFTGFIFLIVSFISISLLEISLGRFLKWIFGAIPSSKLIPESPFSIIKKVKPSDFWTPFIVFTLVYIMFPFFSFIIFSIVF
jgi:hypothetical protein